MQTIRTTTTRETYIDLGDGYHRDYTIKEVDFHNNQSIKVSWTELHVDGGPVDVGFFELVYENYENTRDDIAVEVSNTDDPDGRIDNFKRVTADLDVPVAPFETIFGQLLCRQVEGGYQAYTFNPSDPRNITLDGPVFNTVYSNMFVYHSTMQRPFDDE